MAENEHLEILALKEGATQKEIKIAYRKLAKKLHPDREGGDKIKFQQLNCAYVALLKLLKAPENQTRTKNRESDDISSEWENDEDVVHDFVQDISEKTQCIVLKYNKDHSAKWNSVFHSLYGPPTDHGNHGLKYSSLFSMVDEEVTTGSDNENEKLGTIHVTIYESTGKIMVQGNSYLLWYVEHLPHILGFLVLDKSLPSHLQTQHSSSGSNSAKSKTQTNDQGQKKGKKQKESSCSRCNRKDTTKMLWCSSCNQWIHYKCTGLTPNELDPYINIVDNLYNCCEIISDEEKNVEKNVSVCDSKLEVPNLDLKKEDTDIQNEDTALPSSILGKEAFVNHSDNHNSVHTDPSEENSVTQTDNNPDPETPVIESKKAAGETQSVPENNVNKDNDILKAIMKRLDNLEDQIVQSIRKCGRSTEVSTEVENLKSQTNSLQAQNEILKKDLSRYDSQRSRAEKDLDYLRKSQNVNQETFKIVKNECEALKHENRTLKERLKNQCELTAQVDNALKHANASVSCVQQEMFHLKNTLNSNKEEIILKDEETTTLRSRLEDAHSQIKELHDQFQLHRENADNFVKVVPTGISVNKSEKQPLNKVKPVEEKSHQVRQHKPITPKPDIKAKHIVVTCSLGKHLDEQKLSVTPNEKVEVHSLSGATIEDIGSFVTNQNPQQDPLTITLLAGSNNINRNQNPHKIARVYRDVIMSIKSKFPTTPVHICEIPKRMDNEKLDKNTYKLNEQLHGMCSDPELNAYFVHSGVDHNRRFFDKGNFHLSMAGTGRLAGNIKKTLRLYTEISKEDTCNSKDTKEQTETINQMDHEKKELMILFSGLLNRLI
jgi:hypothetical protein